MSPGKSDFRGPALLLPPLDKVRARLAGIQKQTSSVKGKRSAGQITVDQEVSRPGAGAAGRVAEVTVCQVWLLACMPSMHASKVWPAYR